MNSIPQEKQGGSLLPQLNDELAEVASRVKVSLVQVTNGGRSGGAGVVWSPGRVLTNAHVIREQSPQVIFSDGRSAAGELLALDQARDIAILGVDTGAIPPLPHGDSRRLRTGDWILAIGHPWGVIGAASAGSVIAVGPPAEPSRPGGGDLLQVGLHLRPGHSGGPMVDSEGRLVGLNAMIAGPQVGLAVPLHVIEEFLHETEQSAEG